MKHLWMAAVAAAACTVMNNEADRAMQTGLRGEYEGWVAWQLPGDTAVARWRVRLELQDSVYEAFLFPDTLHTRAGGRGTWRLRDSIATFHDPRPYADSANPCKVLNRSYLAYYNNRRLMLLDTNCNGWRYEYDLRRTVRR